MDNFRDSYFPIKWDLTKRRLDGLVWGKQYDTGRGLSITVINGGQVVSPTSEIIRLKWEKPDGTTGYVNSTIVSGKFIIENIDQMFTVNGSVRADLELQVGGEFVASVTFYANVEKAVAVDAILSTDHFTVLQTELARVEAAIAGATDGTEVILARGTSATLKTRLDNSDLKLNNIKVNQMSTAIKDLLDIDNFNLSLSTNWEFGGLATSGGTNVIATTRIRSFSAYAPEGTTIQLTNGSTYAYGIHKYTLSGVWIAFLGYSSLTTPRVVVEECLIRVIAKRIDEAVITSGEIPTLVSLFTTSNIYKKDGAGGVFEDKKQAMQNYIASYVSENTEAATSQDYTVGNFIGDSITYGYSPYDGTRMAVKFTDIVGSNLGLTTTNNYGISGSTLGSLVGGTRDPMVDRYVTMPAADLICVFGGTNDWYFNVPLGTVADTDKFTFYGALKLLMDGLYTKYPNSTIVFFTPLHRLGDKNYGGRNLLDYRNAVIEVGEMFGVPVLDLFATSGLYPDNVTNYNTLVPDGRHPNEAGHIKLATRITGFLKTL